MPTEARHRPKGRDQRGELNPNAKMSVKDVKKVRALREKGLTCRAIHETFGGMLSLTQIYNIACRRTWDHVP